MQDPLRQWKLSPMDSESRRRWYAYSRARDLMLDATDTEHAPWYIVRSDDKRRARLNCIAHILRLIPYETVPRPEVAPRARHAGSIRRRGVAAGRRFVPEKY